LIITPDEVSGLSNIFLVLMDSSKSERSMIKRILFVMLLSLVVASGCSTNPVAPDRSTNVFSELYTFQLALSIAVPSLGDPSRIPTNVPIGNLVSQDLMPYCASYTLAAFDVFYEPSDWDDWLESATVDRNASDFEPSDWDDWLVYSKLDNSQIRKAHVAIGDKLKSISLRIDPMNDFEPSDWDDWLMSGQFEPSDWDDWLVNATIQDLANLN
jgi:hypothetical protein